MEKDIKTGDNIMKEFMSNLTKEEAAEILEDMGGGERRRVEDERNYYRTRREQIAAEDRKRELRDEGKEPEFYCGLIPTAQSLFDYTKFSRALTTSYQSLRATRQRSLYYYNTSIRNGYYSGFLSSVICQDCMVVLDCFPSKFKRVFLIPAAACPLCRGKIKRMSKQEVLCVEKETKVFPKDTWEFYYVNYHDAKELKEDL